MAQVTGFNFHKYEAQKFGEAVEVAHRILMRAADEWARGNPEQPPTRELLSEIIRVFEEARFLKRPYGSKKV